MTGTVVSHCGDFSLKEGQDSNESIAWSKKRGGVYIPTPLLYDDYFYMCANHGVLSCYNAKSGEKVYQEPIAEKGVPSRHRLLRRREGCTLPAKRVKSRYELLATNLMNEVCMATPAISEGMLFVRTQHNIFAIGEPADARAKAAK
jgi:hypothetical protein